MKDKSLILNAIKSHYKFKTNEQFADFLGIAPTTLSSWTRRNSIDTELIYAKCTDIDANWLLSGSGEMLKSNKPTSARMPEGAIQLTQSREMPRVVTVNEKGNNTIPLVNVKARAGYLNGYGDPEFVESLPTYGLPGFGNSTLRAFEAEGGSMSPTIHNRDIVFAEWEESLDYIRDNRIYVLVTKNDGVVIKRLLNRIKQYGYVIAKSDAFNNRNEYRNIHVEPEDILEIWHAKMYLSADFSAPNEMHQRMNNLEADVYELMRRLDNGQLQAST